MHNSNLSSVPVILVHYGDSPYLADAFAQARFAQANGRVILLGDDSNRYYRGVEWYPISDYFEDAARFSEVFRLYRLNSYQHRWQMFCFQRWMCLSNFMESNRINHCLTMDSDVLLYEKASIIARLYDDFEMTVIQADQQSISANGATSIVHSRTILRDLCDLMFEMFGKTSLHERIKTFRDGVTDMTALGLLKERFPLRIGNTYSPKNQVAIDQSILLSDGFEMNGDQKRLVWMDGKPYGFFSTDDSSSQIQFGTIHFHGHAKKIIRHNTSQWPDSLTKERNNNIYNFYVRKVLRKLSGLIRF